MEFLIYKELYDDLKLRYSQINEYLDLSDLVKKIDILKDKTLKENFWEDKHSASKILKQISRFEFDLNLLIQNKLPYHFHDLLNEISGLNRMFLSKKKRYVVAYCFDCGFENFE